MTLIDSSSLTAQDIGTPLLVCTYTADADRELSLSIGASGLAGGGTYRACLTKQIGGAGAVYQSPTTAIALAPTVTTCWLPSMPIAVQDGDVVRVYLQGLAADTAVGVVTEVYDTQAELATAAAVADIPTNAELATALAWADDAVLAAIAGLNDFDPAADTVAHVTLVDTTTTNTDMVNEPPSAADIRAAIGMANADLDTQLADIPTDVDTELTSTHGAGGWGTAIGGSTKVYTVTVDGALQSGVYCRMTTDAAGLSNVDAGYTNAAGQVSLSHDLPSGTTVYIWRTLSGVLFVNPDVEEIP